MSEVESNVIHKVIRTTAYPEMVWEAWTDVDKLSQWMVDKATGWPAVGSSLHLTWERFGFTLEYKIAEARECKKLVLKTPIPGGMQTLSVEIRREGGFTVVDLKESAPHFVADDPESSSDSAWQMSLAVMKHYLENYFGQPRSSFFALAGASFSNPVVVRAYSTAEGLSRWLAEAVIEWPSGPDLIGQPFRLILGGAPPMSGRILTITRHEVALSWDEIRGLIELKSFSMGPGRQAVCVRGCGYGMDKETAGTIEDWFRPRLQELSEALPLLAGDPLTSS